MRERSSKDLFHRVGQIIPDEQQLLTVPPDICTRDALQIMKENNVSQVPVVAKNEVLGVFSYRSFAQGVLQIGSKEDPAALPVEAFAENLRFAQIFDELEGLLDEFDLKDAVLVGSEIKLQGIVTTVDALRYFYRVASPYVMLREIELAIRELIRASIDSRELSECIDKCIKRYYEEKSLRVPTSLEEMTFQDYVSILKFKGYWLKFAANFGGAYSVAQTKLGRLPSLRNDVLHFRHELTAEEYDILREVRDWLLKRIIKLEAGRKLVQHE